MKHVFFFIIISVLAICTCNCQEKANSGVKILFHGIVMDAKTLSPVSSSQILINRDFASVGNTDGTFTFYVNRKDSVLFKHLGYKSTLLVVSDTLSGHDFIAGIYMQTDTLVIGEVIIVPRFTNLKSQILNSPSKVPATMDNARYNVAISAYQGRTTRGRLGDPQSNYDLITQKQKNDAYEKGGIPSDRIAGISPLLLIPAAYLLIHGAPERPAPYENKLTLQELDQIQKKYLESLKQQK
jgi:hypothetical protein